MCANPDMIKEYLQIYVKTRGSVMRPFDTYCTCTALLIVPVVVFGGKIPTNALSKSPRLKFTAPRPEFGGASSCQHSRRAVLFAAEMAVMLKAAAWLATSFTRASASAVVIEMNFIVTIRRFSCKCEVKEQVLYKIKTP
jgi:hypothetical protein